MRKVKLLLGLLLLIGGFLSVNAQKKRALVIGIGQYEDSRWGRIHGDSDVDYAVSMLKKNGFEDIQTLRNAAASKSAIIAAFHDLTERCRKGDKVYIHFSGHGQQVTDLDGDEDDGWDEAWIPYDAQPYYSAKYKGEKHLIDDEVNALLSGIKEQIGSAGRLLVIVDACHSGNATRESGDTTIARGFDKKFEIPAEKPRCKPSLAEDWITISACLSYQVNWEMSSPAVGKLTWCLHSLSGSLGRLSNQDLKTSIIRIMQENPGPLEQIPDITGNWSKESVKELFR